jgi:hypothetical protein
LCGTSHTNAPRASMLARPIAVTAHRDPPATLDTPAVPDTSQGPPLSIGRSTASSWREHALARVAEHRFLKLWLEGQIDRRNKRALDAIESHLTLAEKAADGTEPHGMKRLWAALRGASVERARSHLDAAESELIRLAPDSYLLGQLPSLVAHVRAHLPKDDPRRVGIEEIYKRANERVARRNLASPNGRPREKVEDRFEDVERDTIVAAVRHASAHARREVTRVRSFRNVLLVTAVFLTLGAAGMVVVGVTNPSVVPLCFNPDGMVVCPTDDRPAPGQSGARGGTAAPQLTPKQQARVDNVMRDTANKWDIPLVELVGFIAAAVAAASALRRIRGTSTEYSLPVALAVLKLPTGALTALLGLLLMRGDFIPGLSALDSTAQIIAWAILFGYAQQLLTRFVDDRAQGLLADVAPGDPAQRREPASTPVGAY